MSNDLRLPLSRFRAAAALYVLDNADSTVLVKAADALLDAGIYSWSIGELATTPQSALCDIGRLFESSLKELAIPLPSVEEAARTLARWHLYGVIEGRESPWRAIVRLRDELSYPLRFDRRLSNLEPQLRFISLWYRYEDLHEEEEAGFVNREDLNRAVAELDREFLERAWSWMRQDSPRLLDPSWLSWNGGIVSKLAQAIAAEQDWDRLLILADALEEAGCGNVELLEHCRAGARHEGHCWITDILLRNDMARPS